VESRDWVFSEESIFTNTSFPMNATQLIVLNFEEIRRRSIKLWKGIPESSYQWRPDAHALSCLEMVRHVLEGEHLFHKIVLNRGNLGDYESPWVNRLYTNLEEEIRFSQPYRESFLNTISHFTEDDLECVEIVRSEKGQRRKLGDYLNRIAYHEAVHDGQMLSYLRTLQVDRPQVWD
jgi:uncharacterized damage-inducible protein DinB